MHVKLLLKNNKTIYSLDPDSYRDYFDQHYE